MAVTVAACGGHTSGCGSTTTPPPSSTANIQQPEGGTSFAIGKLAPAVEGTDLAGAHAGLVGLRGAPVLVNFWASWCIPCQKEFPQLAATLKRHPGVNVLGVVYQDSRANAISFARAHHANWPAVVDCGGRIASSYGITAIPVTVAVDAHGIVRSRHLGPVSATDADNLVRAAGGT